MHGIAHFWLVLSARSGGLSELVPSDAATKAAAAAAGGVPAASVAPTVGPPCSSVCRHSQVSHMKGRGARLHG